MGRRVHAVTSDYNRGTFRPGILEEHGDQPKGHVPPMHPVDSTSSALAQSPRLLMPKMPGLRFGEILRNLGNGWNRSGIASHGLARLRLRQIRSFLAQGGH